MAATKNCRPRSATRRCRKFRTCSSWAPKKRMPARCRSAIAPGATSARNLSLNSSHPSSAKSNPGQPAKRWPLIPMLSKNQIVPLLLSRCPQFEGTWQKHRGEWGQQEAGIYNDLAAFVRFLVEAYERNDTQFFPIVFQTIETLFVEGDQEVRDAAGYGILETLQCVASSKPFGPRAFVH